MRLIIGITGATGTIYGVRLLERLRESDVETHLVISRWGARTLAARDALHARAGRGAGHGGLRARATWARRSRAGRFKTDGMIIAPCSAKTLAAIAHGFGENLIHRAADVVLKERRKLVLAVREAPLSSIHLENMLTLRGWALVMPPLPAFYNHPRTIDDIVDYTVARMLDQFGLKVRGAERWVGEMEGRRIGRDYGDQTPGPFTMSSSSSILARARVRSASSTACAADSASTAASRAFCRAACALGDFSAAAASAATIASSVSFAWRRPS